MPFLNVVGANCNRAVSSVIINYRPYPGGVASRLATVINVAVAMQFNMTILIAQMTQISNMKVIGFMVDFLKSSNFGT